MEEEKDLKPLNILIVDDEPGLRDMLQFGLKKRGFQVVGASNGEEALQIAQKQPFDLAVCDIMMPGINGIEVLKRLKEILPDVEVIMATGYATLETAVEAMKSGAFDYITKPYSLSHLCAIFDKAQEHRRLKAKVGYLEQLNRLKSEFMATMSHELRTPLASMLGYISLLHKNVYGKVPPNQEKVLERVEINGRNLLQLINNILDLSKLSAHRMSLFAEDFDLNPLIQEVLEAMMPLTAAKKLSLRFDESSPVWLHTDKTKLKQVLINLIGNAIKFTKAGGITVSIKHLPDPAHIELAVRDSGIGIAAEDAPLLFQEFRQIDSSLTREYGGTGLGLSICKKIVELMNGTIRVESELGKGSTFIVDIPARIETPQIEQEKPAPLETPSDSDEQIILSIDDDPDVLKVLQDSLRGTGFRSVGARSGEEGIALARQLRPKIITLDIMMSHMDGWSVLQTFKNDPILKSIPVYIVSVIDNKALAYSLGVTGYILKPFDRDELLRTLQVVSKETAKQILVVDDDPAVRHFFSQSLSQEGYDVEAVASGEEAMSRMKHLKPDILFLDLVLPVMSGFDVLEALEQLPTAEPTAIFVMAEKELTPEQQGYLDRRVQMILKKRAEGFADLLPALKIKLTSIRKAVK